MGLREEPGGFDNRDPDLEIAVPVHVGDRDLPGLPSLRDPLPCCAAMNPNGERMGPPRIQLNLLRAAIAKEVREESRGGRRTQCDRGSGADQRNCQENGQELGDDVAADRLQL